MDRESDSGLLGSVSYLYRVDKYDLGPGQALGSVFWLALYLTVVPGTLCGLCIIEYH